MAAARPAAPLDVCGVNSHSPATMPARHDHGRSSQLDRIERMLRVLLQIEEYQMGAIDDLRTAVSAERTVTESVVTLLTDINQRLKDAIASGDPAALAAITADLQGNTAALAAAVTANTQTPANA